MSYMIDLDEHRAAALVGELLGRANVRVHGQCDYCLRWDDGAKSCKFPERHQGREVHHPIEAVLEERARQDIKWGPQNHPSGTRDDARLLRDTSLPTYGTLAYRAKQATDEHARRGDVTYADIFVEEVFEALSCDHPDELRKELVQVAAVAVAWIEAINRNEAAEPARG